MELRPTRFRSRILSDDLYLSAYARQPARGPTMGPFCGYVGHIGLCWSILRAMWAHLVAMLAYVGLRLIHVEPKDPKNGNSKKTHCKTQDILMVGGLSWGCVGPSWGYVGRAMLAHLGAMLAHLGAILAHLEGYVGRSWGYVGPSWGLCWSILRPMLAHVDPS